MPSAGEAPGNMYSIGSAWFYWKCACVIDLWNALPQFVVMPSDLDAFQRELLDRFLEDGTAEASCCKIEKLFARR